MTTRRVEFVCVALTLSFLLAPSVAAQGAGIGRIFFTPDERRALEVEAGDRKPETGKSSGSELVFNGVVRRSAGRSTVWVNGAPLDLLPREVRSRYRLHGNRLYVDDSFGPIRLAPGEARKSRSIIGANGTTDSSPKVKGSDDQ